MKFSKSALRTRHVRLAHRTMIPLAEVATDEDREPSPSRTYSTERFAKANNGIVIPQQLRERIEASVVKADEDRLPLTFLSGGRGFF